MVMYSHTDLRSAAASSDTHRTLPHRQEATRSAAPEDGHGRFCGISTETCVGSDTLTVTDAVRFHISRTDQN